MQAQRQRQDHEQAQDQEMITQTRSLVAVKTLITAGFGCLTFLRGLLPDDNFEDARLSSLTASIHKSSDNTSISGTKNTKLSGVCVKTVKRGYSTEGDQMLNYIENGVFDALSKCYLKSFVFAVYLDKENPTNIVEAWTFNFRYNCIPGTDEKVPSFSIDREMEAMSISGSREAVAALPEGNIVTLGDVKKSLKQLVRALISASQGLDSLPSRRFATIKLYYVDETPVDYEPPFFVPADSTTNRFVFSTHDPNEPPEKVNIGMMDTTFHAVSVSIASIASVIPSTEDDAAQFVGLSNIPGRSSSINGMNFKTTQQKEIEAQEHDALKRCVVWDAEGISNLVPGTEDAEGEIDPDYPGNMMAPASLEAPLGIRGPDGIIQKIAISDVAHDVVKSKRQDQRDVNFSSQTSSKLMAAPPSQGEATQNFHTQTGYLRSTSDVHKENPETPQNLSVHPQARTTSKDTTNSASIENCGVDTQELKLLLSGEPTQSTSLRIDPMFSNRDRESISSFSSDNSTPTHALYPPKESNDSVVQTPPSLMPLAHVTDENGDLVMQDSILSLQQCSVVPETMDTTNSQNKTQIDTEMDTQKPDCPSLCDCGSKSEELEWIHCEYCNGWFHVWCMGYHNLEDPRVTVLETFECFSCQLRADPNSTLLMEEQIDGVILAWGELALFRHALKVVSTDKDPPDLQTSLKKRLGIDMRTAGQLWRRMEQEGFISPEAKTLNPFNSVKTKTFKTKRTAKRYWVNTQECATALDRYFEPRGDLEMKAVGLKSLRGKPKNILYTSVPQDRLRSSDLNLYEPAHDALPTDLVPFPGTPALADASHDVPSGSKRKNEICPVEDSRFPAAGITAKKMKISLAEHPLDLEEF